MYARAMPLPFPFSAIDNLTSIALLRLFEKWSKYEPESCRKVGNFCYEVLLARSHDCTFIEVGNPVASCDWHPSEFQLEQLEQAVVQAAYDNEWCPFLCPYEEDGRIIYHAKVYLTKQIDCVSSSESHNKLACRLQAHLNALKGEFDE
jgi:hypothetical protein